MTGIHDFIPYLIASALMWVTPGPDTMITVSRSIAQGRLAGMLTVLGSASGAAIHTLFAAIGISAAIAASASLFSAIKVLGAAYLIWLGISTIRRSAQVLTRPPVETVNAWRIYRQGFLTNLLNPKVALFFMAFLPQFVDSAMATEPLPFLILGAVYIAGGTLWSLVFVLFAASATGSLRRHSRTAVWLNRLMGCAFVGLGCRLLASQDSSSA